MTLEHIAPTGDFVGTLRRAIGDRTGTLVFFQVPDTTRILADCAFEDIYYEHCSYFSPGSLARLFRHAGFEVLALSTEYQDQYLTIDLPAGSTTVTVNDTTGYSVPGVLWIEGEKVTYTGVTATEFTGVPATGDGSISIDHNSGARIGQLYALPTDYATATRLTYNNGYVLPFVKEEDIVLQYNNRKDWRMLDPSGSSTQGQRPIFLRPPFYTVVHGTWLLPMNITAAGSQLWLQYEKKPTTMTDAAPTVTIPEEWATLTIPVLASGVAAERDLVNQLPSMPRVRDGAHLKWLMFSTGATSANSPFIASLDFGWGG
jgi:hypothetical protein